MKIIINQIRTNSSFNDNYIKYERNGDKNKTLSIKKYLNMIKPYLRDIIQDNKTQGELKIQLILIINFISSKDSDEIRTMHKKNNNIKIIMDNETDEIIEKHFESLLQKYQEGLEEKMEVSEFVFDSIDLLHYKLPKIL